MSGFEKAWLERKPMKNRAAAPCFERLVLPDGYREEAGKPFATALSELRLAAGELFGVNMVCEDPEGRGSACAAEGKKGIRLKENPALLPEAYRIQGSESEILLEACDEAGFLYAAPQPNPDLGWNALMLFPALYDSYGYCTRVFLYFDSEESVNAFCRTQIPDLATGLPVEGVTWRYAE